MEELAQDISAEHATPNDNVIFVNSAKEKKSLMKQIRHEQKITKDRNLRWTQKFASAKIEDLLLLAQDFQTLLYQLEVIIKVATKHIPTFAEEVEAQKQHDKQRVEVYKQLKADTTMSLEEKKAKAAEWDISPALLGITEESTNQEKGDV